VLSTLLNQSCSVFDRLVCMSILLRPAFVMLTVFLLQIYDYILTLHIEIKFIWFSPWTYTKVLYLLIRYLTFIDTMLYTVGRFYLPEIISNMIYIFGRTNIFKRSDRSVQSDIPHVNV
jgi:hypothetical protein